MRQLLPGYHLGHGVLLELLGNQGRSHVELCNIELFLSFPLFPQTRLNVFPEFYIK